MIFLTVLNQVDTLKYDYISHYFVLRYTLTSALTLYDHDGAVFLLWFKQTCSLLYKLQREGVGTPLAKLLYYYKDIYFLCQYDLFFYTIKVDRKSNLKYLSLVIDTSIYISRYYSY